MTIVGPDGQLHAVQGQDARVRPRANQQRRRRREPLLQSHPSAEYACAAAAANPIVSQSQ